MQQPTMMPANFHVPQLNDHSLIILPQESYATFPGPFSDPLSPQEASGTPHSTFDERRPNTVSWEELKVRLPPGTEDMPPPGILPDGSAYAPTTKTKDKYLLFSSKNEYVSYYLNFWFSVNNLQRDGMIRALMPDGMSVPVDKLLEFPRLVALNVTAQDIDMAVSTLKILEIINVPSHGLCVKRVDCYPITPILQPHQQHLALNHGYSPAPGFADHQQAAANLLLASSQHQPIMWNQHPVYSSSPSFYTAPTSTATSIPSANNAAPMTSNTWQQSTTTLSASGASPRVIPTASFVHQNNASVPPPPQANPLQHYNLVLSSMNALSLNNPANAANRNPLDFYQGSSPINQGTTAAAIQAHHQPPQFMVFNPNAFPAATAGYFAATAPHAANFAAFANYPQQTNPASNPNNQQSNNNTAAQQANLFAQLQQAALQQQQLLTLQALSSGSFAPYALSAAVSGNGTPQFVHQPSVATVTSIPPPGLISQTNPMFWSSATPVSSAQHQQQLLSPPPTSATPTATSSIDEVFQHPHQHTANAVQQPTQTIRAASLPQTNSAPAAGSNPVQAVPAVFNSSSGRSSSSGIASGMSSHNSSSVVTVSQTGTISSSSSSSSSTQSGSGLPVTQSGADKPNYNAVASKPEEISVANAFNADSAQQPQSSHHHHHQSHHHGSGLVNNNNNPAYQHRGGNKNGGYYRSGKQNSAQQYGHEDGQHQQHNYYGNYQWRSSRGGGVRGGNSRQQQNYNHYNNNHYNNSQMSNRGGHQQSHNHASANTGVGAAVQQVVAADGFKKSGTSSPGPTAALSVDVPAAPANSGAAAASTVHQPLAQEG